MRNLIEDLEALTEAEFKEGPRKGDKTDAKGFDKPGNGKGGSDQVIKALRDTDYKDKDAFFKMVQLLKGMAVNSEKDETAKKFMSAVSDALTTAAKSVLGEDVLDEAKKAYKLTYVITNLGRTGKQIEEARGDFRRGSVKSGAMSMYDALSSLSHVYDELEPIDGRFKGVRNDIRSAMSKAIKFDKELPEQVDLVQKSR